MYDPERYEENKSAAKRDADEHVPQLISQMEWKNEDEEILDYGCGAGSVTSQYFLPMALRYNSNITAVDISNEMLGHAKKAYGNSRINYLQGNLMAEDFPLKDKQYDKIFSIYVLHFIRDYRQAFQNFYNLLKPGGQFGFTVCTISSIFRLLQVAGEDPKWAEYMKGYREFVPEWYERKDKEDPETEFRAALEKIGFKIKHIETFKKTFYNPNIEVSLDFFLSLNPYLLKIPENLRSELREDYRKYITSFYNVDLNTKELNGRYEMVTCVVVKPNE